jgi:acyl-CoA reductase-like NAD-dependent aldehyde dehydrogenase
LWVVTGLESISSLGALRMESVCKPIWALKNHAAILPDANKQHALNSIVGAAFGAAGQRCMALSTLVMVGETKDWLPELAESAKTLEGQRWL